MLSSKYLEKITVMETKNIISAGFSCSGGLTRRRKYDKFFVENAMTKTCIPGKIPREDTILVQGVRNTALDDTTSELPTGNGWTGAPVTVPMSDGPRP